MFKILLSLLWALSLYAQSPKWLDSGLKIVSSFGLQDYKEGYGLIINEGLIITSASLVYRDARAKDILLYDSQSPSHVVSCLSYAEILALDANLDLAILKPQKFTDIYCNILPEPNLRALNFKEKSFDIFNDSYLNILDYQLKVEYFFEQEWSNFASEQTTLEAIENLPWDQKQKMIGMPLFVENKFVGILRNEGDILKGQEILKFICKIHQTTSILDSYFISQEYCQ
ncbi:hypothetical protein [Helicobacter canadensis]|uniref:Periplasmic protein n=1 Tax=Helicobacter canadensis MIT 98-5491 TaxID=537970 RepID=C5ZX53_9HELI|nr:hypothetical protein [Helicobacter canadensis]EES89721.1 hypothetical protein HCAN_1008 [Helicobacter canadensis MIT 98-5491]EFR48514.1 hypothetical protein HCMG_00687 [Helicobacter canadensis MIT 98-5491]STO99759.1 Uncharacterised protein [Helicobacter canadensis]